MTEICFRVAHEAFVDCAEEETKVMTELYERITIRRTREAVATRTVEEVAALLALRWKLQTYRGHLLAKKHRQDIAEETLTDAEIQGVRGSWENQAMYWDLNEKQLRTEHLPSIYNAALNNRTGWIAAANAIIKYRLPQLPTLHQHLRT